MNTNLSEYDLSTYLVLKYVFNFLVNTGPEDKVCLQLISKKLTHS